MLNTSQIEKFFNVDGHLSEEGIAIWVDALQYQKTEVLPDKVKEHVENCALCKSSVVEVYSVIGQENRPLSEHPYFSGTDHQNQQAGKFKIKLWIKIAASLLILATIAVALLFQTRHTNNSGELFAEYFSPYPNIVLERNLVQEHQNKSFITAMDYYDKGEFGSATQYFEKTRQAEVLSDTALFYYGNVSLATGNAKQAIVLFEQLLTDSNSQFSGQAEWYLALAYLSADKPEQCLQQLKKIIDEDTHHKTEAQELVRKIE